VTGFRGATQKDVARAAGVSTASVSRMLNGIGPVKPAVRARIEQAITALDYVPHEGARALVTRRSLVLGAVIPTLNNAIFAEGINAFEAEARAHGFTLVLSVSNYDLMEERTLVRRMVQHGVDGLLLVGNEHAPDSFEVLRRSKVAHLCTWAFDTAGPAPNVGFRNAEAMADVVDLLVSLGHRRFAMLAGVQAGNDRARARVAGVQARLQSHGLHMPEALLAESPYTIRAAREAFITLMHAQAGADRPTAMICGNDVIGIGALLEARRFGIEVPQELSITGFDNLAIAAEMEPPMTTVEVPAEQMGRAAALALIEAIGTGRAVEGALMPTRLLVRGTTAAAPVTHWRA